MFLLAAERRKPTAASVTVGLGFLLIATVGTLVVLFRKHASSASYPEDEQEFADYHGRSPGREGRQFIVSFVQSEDQDPLHRVRLDRTSHTVVATACLSAC